MMLMPGLARPAMGPGARRSLRALAAVCVVLAPLGVSAQDQPRPQSGPRLLVTPEVALGRYLDVEYSNIGEAASVAVQLELPIRPGLGVTLDGAVWHFGVSCIGFSPCGELGASGVAGVRYTPAPADRMAPYLGLGAGLVRWDHGGVDLVGSLRTGLDVALGPRSGVRLEVRYQPIRHTGDELGGSGGRVDQLLMLAAGLRVGVGRALVPGGSP